MNVEDEALLKNLDVSRETMERLAIYVGLTEKWNPKINLVSRSSLKSIWSRHIADSIQVFRCASAKGKWVDIGSGGGFPGMVVAILSAAENADIQVTLIESDQRKCAFLRTVARESEVSCKVIANRIEQVEPQRADYLSARALADFSDLLDHCERHMNEGGTALFPKGVTWKNEVQNARNKWCFDVEPIKSKTEAGAVILKVRGVSRV